VSDATARSPRALSVRDGLDTGKQRHGELKRGKKSVRRAALHSRHQCYHQGTAPGARAQHVSANCCGRHRAPYRMEQREISADLGCWTFIQPASAPVAHLFGEAESACTFANRRHSGQANMHAAWPAAAQPTTQPPTPDERPRRV
jgi:hypothetical protein